MTPGHDPFASLQERTAAELVAALAVYEFRDLHGHPLRNCAEFVELQRRAGDGCDAWFKVERPTAAESIKAAYAAVRFNLQAARAAQDEACALVRAAGYSVPDFGAVAGRNASAYGAMAEASLQGMNNLYAATQAAAVVAQTPRRPADPADPEPAVQEPKPKPPLPTLGAAERQDLIHEATNRRLSSENGLIGNQRMTQYVEAYLAAKQCVATRTA